LSFKNKIIDVTEFHDTWVPDNIQSTPYVYK
jgi:hypothetical protein